MTRTIAWILIAMAPTFAACGADDSNEGKACSAADDCGGNLTCQPIQGRNQDYCCPTPANESKQSTCQPAQ